MKTISNFAMSMFCKKNRVYCVIFHFIKIFHSKLLSSFLQILLSHVVFAVANNSAVLIRLSIANQNVILVYIMFGSSKFQDFRLYFRVLYEVSIFSSALNSVKKYRNTDLRASAKTVPTEPYRRGLQPSPNADERNIVLLFRKT